MGEPSRPDDRLASRIMETSPAAIVVVDPEGRITFSNARAELVLGLSRDAATQLTYNAPQWRATDLDGVSFPEEALPFRRVMATRQPVNDVRHAIEKPDGTRTLLSVNAAPLLDDAGELTGMVATLEDITERWRVEQALADSERRGRSFIDGSPMGIHMYDLLEDGRLVFVGANPAADRILRIDHRDLVGKTIVEAFPPLVETEVPERYRRAAAHGEAWQTRHIAYHDQRISGAYEVFAFQTTPGSMATLFLDITTRLQAEEQLRLARYSIEHAADAAFWVDASGRLLEVNQAACDALGYTREELCASMVFDIVPHLSAETWAERWALLRQQAAYHTETEHRRKDGATTPVEVTASHVAFEGREYVFAWARDISARRRAEEENRRLEAQLRQQQKLESIGTLAAGVAHEINNPLNGILNYAQLMHDRLPPEDPLRRYAENIIRESERVTNIVRNLLDFSRQHKQSHSPARLQDIVPNTLSLVAALFRRDQIQIQADIPADLPSFKCRSQQIQQVLLNLLTNARDALNTRFPEAHEDKRIVVTARAFDRDGRRWLRVTVADHGAGIAADLGERIFDPFFTTKPREMGTGLGLAVSYGIVKAHRGTLRFESQPGAGTRFHLEIPVDNGWDLEAG
jgi:PAS domain S-box-containing protein